MAGKPIILLYLVTLFVTAWLPGNVYAAQQEKGMVLLEYNARGKEQVRQAFEVIVINKEPYLAVEKGCRFLGVDIVFAAKTREAVLVKGDVKISIFAYTGYIEVNNTEKIMLKKIPRVIEGTMMVSLDDFKMIAGKLCGSDEELRMTVRVHDVQSKENTGGLVSGYFDDLQLYKEIMVDDMVYVLGQVYEKGRELGIDLAKLKEIMSDLKIRKEKDANTAKKEPAKK